MKKLLSVFALLVAIMAVSFAANVAPTTESGSVNIREGHNVVRLRNGSTLSFMARSGEIANIEIRKPTGQVIKFDDDTCPSCGVQPPKPCNGETRCVYSEKHKAYICFCIPKPVLSSGSGAVEYVITLEDAMISSQH